MKRIWLKMLIFAIPLLGNTQPGIRLYDALHQINELDQQRWQGTDVLKIIALPGETVDFQLALFDFKGPVQVQLPPVVGVEINSFLELQVTVRNKKTIEGNRYPDILFPYPADGRGRIVLPPARPEIASRLNFDFTVIWFDLRIAESGLPESVSIPIEVNDGKTIKQCRVELLIRKPMLQKRTRFSVDFNEYGAKYLSPYLKTHNDYQLWKIEKEFYRLAHEHRGTLNVLPYKSQTGVVREGMAPEINGSGNDIYIVDWAPFDERYGAYFDGSAFDDGQPIDHFYLPFNPNWPAQFDYFYLETERYQKEWRQIANAYVRHFKQRGWNSTTFQVYMNQKPGAKNHIPWNLDEPKGRSDYLGLRGFCDLFEKSFLPLQGLDIRFRIDISHFYCDKHRGNSRKDFELNNGDEILEPVHIWVISDHSMKSLKAKEKARYLKTKGRQVWKYGATPKIKDRPADVFTNMYLDWYHGFDGAMVWKSLCRELDRGTGKNFIFYSGKEFGLEKPLASIRMKLMRDAIQDLDILVNVGEVSFLELRKIFKLETRLAQRRAIFELLGGKQ